MQSKLPVWSLQSVACVEEMSSDMQTSWCRAHQPRVQKELGHHLLSSMGPLSFLSIFCWPLCQHRNLSFEGFAYHLKTVVSLLFSSLDDNN